MPVYEVGKPYDPRRRTFPSGNDFNFRKGSHELRLFTPSPTRHEVAAVKATGSSEFALYVEPPLISLCYRFESGGRGIPWSDANFSWHAMAAALPPEELVLPPPWEEGSPELRALLDVMLIDADTGIIAAIKLLTFSPEFTGAIHRAIWEQAHAPFDRIAYARAADDLYRRYPTSAALAAACRIRTPGGA